MKYEIGDHFKVKFGRKYYDTVIAEDGVQRFIKDVEIRKKYDAGEINLNNLAEKVYEGKMRKIDFLEFRMKLGYSVSGLWDCYPGYTVENPLWDNEEPRNEQ